MIRLGRVDYINTFPLAWSLARHLGDGLPEEVVVIEVEPGIQEFGEEFSEPVAKVVDQVCELAVTMATDAGAAEP